MPFKSQRQLSLCYAKRLSAEAKGRTSTWNCDEWLEETPKSGCLPVKKGSGSKGCKRVTNQGRSPYMMGSRGGIFFYAGGVKVYVPRDAKAHVLKTYTVKRI